MRHVLPSAKRLLTLLGAAGVGTIAALSMGTAALACHPVITHDVDCVEGQPGKVKVTWEVRNSEREAEAKVLKVEPATAGIKKDDRIAGRNASSGTKVLTGTTILDASAGKATLTVKLGWRINGTDVEDSRTREATFANLRCGSPPPPPPSESDKQPTVKFTSRCDGTVQVIVTNPRQNAIDVTVVGKEFTKPVTVEPGKSSDPVVVPAANASEVQVVKGANGPPIGRKYSWDAPKNCDAPDVNPKASCDGRSILITNPSGNRPIEAKITAGAEVKTVTVQPGKTETVTLDSAVPTLTATVKIGKDETTLRFDKAKDCVPPPPGSGTSPTLPVTGPEAGLMAGGALGLTGIGAGLYLITRRRRIQFTA